MKNLWLPTEPAKILIRLRAERTCNLVGNAVPRLLHDLNRLEMVIWIKSWKNKQKVYK